ncbi:MAG: UDP-3-O-(3-hydroxymyristoyl)glucosamine N-acyltransferase [Bacteroides sp.]
MELTAAMIADYLGGDVEGDPTTRVSEFAKIEEGTTGNLSFLSNPKYEHYLYTTESSIVLVNRTLKLKHPVKATLIRVDDSYGSLAKLLTYIESQRPRKKGIHPTAIIEESATIGREVYIGPYVYVGENAIIEDYVQLFPHTFVGDMVRIGTQSILYAGVKVYTKCEVGERCIIHAGAVIGSDGFGFARDADQKFTKIPQMGNVIVGNDCEIGANTTIDRAASGATRLNDNIKLDNLVQIAHNVEIGENTVMAAQTGIAGSTKVGKNCMFGGQVGIVGHVTITDGVQIGAQAGISNSIRNAKDPLMGTPAMPVHEFYKSSVLFRRFPEFNDEITRLRNEVDKLQTALQELKNEQEKAKNDSLIAVNRS